MLPSAPLPWVSSQMTSPEVAHRGVVAVVAAGEAVAAIAATAAAQADATLSRLEETRRGMASPLELGCRTFGADYDRRTGTRATAQVTAIGHPATGAQGLRRRARGQLHAALCKTRRTRGAP
jgi:hypothetical protein